MPATRILAQTYLRVGRQFPLVGVGGVDSAEAACAKIEAGATLVQVYSGLVFEGPALVEKIKAGLVERLEGAELAELVGRGAERWASAT